MENHCLWHRCCDTDMKFRSLLPDIIGRLAFPMRCARTPFDSHGTWGTTSQPSHRITPSHKSTSTPRNNHCSLARNQMHTWKKRPRFALQIRFRENSVLKRNSSTGREQRELDRPLLSFQIPNPKLAYNLKHKTLTKKGLVFENPDKKIQLETQLPNGNGPKSQPYILPRSPFYMATNSVVQNMQ